MTQMMTSAQVVKRQSMSSQTVFTHPEDYTLPTNVNTLGSKNLMQGSGLEIISRLAPVKLSGQTYFCSDTTHFWPDKSPLRHISTKFPPSPCSMMFTYQTSTFSKPLLYMEPRTHRRKSGMHGTATTFGKINITFVHASIASVLCLLYR